MENTLYQRDIFFNRKWFLLMDQGLKVNQENLFKSDEYLVNYEDIGFKVIRTKSGKRGWLIGAGFFFILSLVLFIDRRRGGDVEEIAELLYLMLGIGCILVYLTYYKNSFYLVNSDNRNAIEFLADKPSKEKLELFIGQIKTKQKEVLLDMYGKLNKNLNYETQYNNLRWLRIKGILNKEEFKNSLQQLDNLYSSKGTIDLNISEN